ncbi:PREDICTED: uncharacterized protein LOC109233454 [Nicotiana attenuata]|uniref:Uncharacterized protein n=1 Tax=Nicotiana attenuata TaxID=49451 RepID=A0A1J6IRR4_NICAT|nr:PREDICTED: uncharacterized protein LOC109233454 [Nicotiana attenuata]OIT07410.1 hypothetical protein A4A49_12494 [Nicotiana attenuata]
MARKASKIIPQAKQPIGKSLKSEASQLVAAQLQEAVKPLQLLNMIHTTVFTLNAVNTLGLTVKSYIRRTRVLLSISSDPTMLKEIAMAAARAGVYDLSMPADRAGWNLSPVDILKISEWMKSPDGENYMRLIYKRQKLEKKVRSEMYNKEAALVQAAYSIEPHLDQLLSIQLQGYRAEVKKIRSDYDKKIERLHREIQRLESLKARVLLKEN